MTRRIFGTRAALFVLGCALQISGAASLLKRALITKAEQIQAGMIFNPQWNGTAAGRAEVWQVIAVVPDSVRPESTPDVLCALHSRPMLELTESDLALRLCEAEQHKQRMEEDREPRVCSVNPWCLTDYNFHFPGI